MLYMLYLIIISDYLYFLLIVKAIVVIDLGLGALLQHDIGTCRLHELDRFIQCIGGFYCFWPIIGLDRIFIYGYIHIW